MTDEIKKAKKVLQDLKKQELENKKLELAPTEVEGISVGYKTVGGKKVKYSVRDNRDRIFFPAEWKKFFDQLTPKQKFTFEVLINTGARINEAINVKKEDLFLDNKRLILKVTKVKAVKNMKKPKPRLIMLSTQFSKKLKKETRNLKEEDKIGMLSKPGAHYALKTALKKSDIKNWQMISIHNIRKTLENWLWSLGVKEEKLVKYFGHDLKTASDHYLQDDAYTFSEKDAMEEIIGDLAKRLKGESD